mmetsp:Transcript_50710/g.118994  ORF Transcript_50710/g.118994 Transcript_50710/m.118994 type:complete len:216 (+) Transcript_50710:1290-1937(+)
MELSRECRWNCERQSIVRKSCPNFMPSLIFSQKAKNRSMALVLDSSSSKKSASCIRGKRSCGAVAPYSSMSTRTAATACLCTTSDSSCSAVSAKGKLRFRWGKNAWAPRLATAWINCRPPAFASLVGPDGMRGSTSSWRHPDRRSLLASKTSARPLAAPLLSTSDTSSLVSVDAKVLSRKGTMSRSQISGSPKANDPKDFAASCCTPMVGCSKHS